MVSSQFPSEQEVDDAVRVLLRWTGDDPEREGLVDTPGRVRRAFQEYFAGYQEDPVQYLTRTFEETGGYDDMVILRDIQFVSFCEHHLAPFSGKVHVAYLPDQRIVGISKLARVVDAFARRLQVQEKLTAQIANAIEHTLAPKGVAVMIEAVHQCMTNRGVHKHGVSMVTSTMRGAFRESLLTRKEFLAYIGSSGGSSC